MKNFLAIGAIGIIVRRFVTLSPQMKYWYPQVFLRKLSLGQEVVRQLPSEKEVERKSWSDRWNQRMDDDDDDNFGTNCNLELISNLTGTDLEKIQNERKATINEVCNMCSKYINRSSMECNHVSLDGDKHSNLIYMNLLVDDNHKVCTFCNIFHLWLKIFSVQSSP